MVKSHESKTKDCCVNDVKIKGSNYNLSRGLITKLQNLKDQIKMAIWIWEQSRFMDNCSLSSPQQLFQQ
jgi:hypothetical protein